MSEATDAVLDVLNTLHRELDRFRQASVDPSSEPLSIDQLQTVVARVYEEMEHRS